jgi:hypothetical protein
MFHEEYAHKSNFVLNVLSLLTGPQKYLWLFKKFIVISK